MSRIAGSLDANVIIRILTGDVPQLTQAAISLISSGKDYAICDIALIEVIYALNEYYKTPRNEVALAINELTSNPHLIYNFRLFKDILHMYVVHSSLSIEDCFLAVKAKYENKAPLWTFDKKLATQSLGLAKLINQESTV